jgi:hypothetical protein
VSRTGGTVASFADLTSAAAWLTTEHRTLVAAIHQAVLSGPRQAVWLLTDAMPSHFWASGRMSDWLSCGQAAVAVAREEGDVPGMAAAMLALADAHVFQERDAFSLYAGAGRGGLRGSRERRGTGLSATAAGRRSCHCREG